MTKKDYQAIAGALYLAKPDIRGKSVTHSQWRVDVDRIAGALADDNPRFSRETFVAACEDGNVGRRPKRKRTVTELIHGRGHVSAADTSGAPYVMLSAHDGEPLPPCVKAMQCYCAGHARGLAASEPCDTRE